MASQQAVEPLTRFAEFRVSQCARAARGERRLRTYGSYGLDVIN